jgi:hypothetical protein
MYRCEEVEFGTDEGCVQLDVLGEELDDEKGPIVSGKV